MNPPASTTPADSVHARTPFPTWEQLAALEPRLAKLALAVDRVAAARDPWCSRRGWYGHGGVRERLRRLVGQEADAAPPALRTPAAYDVAYHHLYARIPACRGCDHGAGAPQGDRHHA